MTKRHQAKYKIDRRMGQNIWGRPKSPINKREYGPGQHGQRRKGKLSDYGVQLRAKQKLKGYYANMSERHFRGIYDEARRLKGDTGANMIGLLERRLDTVIYRAKFVPTVFAARQFISHGHIMVNGKRVTVSSFRVKVGDQVEVKEKSRQLALVLEATRLAERDVPDYIDVDHSKMTAKLCADAGSCRCALPGADGAAPRGRILLALIGRGLRQHRGVLSRSLGPTALMTARRSAIRMVVESRFLGSGTRQVNKLQRRIGYKLHADALSRHSIRDRARTGRDLGRGARFPSPAKPLSLSSDCSSPAWNISRMMSQPPTNSPLT